MPSRSGTKFTAERRKRILEGIEKGLPRRLAAARAGIGKSTFYDWLAIGEKSPNGAYGKFVADLEEAESRFADSLLEKWQEAAIDDWRAAESLLSRRLPDEFGKRDRQEISGPKGEPIRVEVKWPGVRPE